MSAIAAVLILRFEVVYWFGIGHGRAIADPVSIDDVGFCICLCLEVGFFRVQYWIYDGCAYMDTGTDECTEYGVTVVGFFAVQYWIYDGCAYMDTGTDEYAYVDTGTDGGTEYGVAIVGFFAVQYWIYDGCAYMDAGTDGCAYMDTGTDEYAYMDTGTDEYAYVDTGTDGGTEYGVAIVGFFAVQYWIYDGCAYMDAGTDGCAYMDTGTDEYAYVDTGTDGCADDVVAFFVRF
ncbi:hypothetical protein G195_002962 [Phytophthora kernoviae 00238/432]|uniref:Uncharacterized protein n=1 Tax=Phytophthora kernoviae 00238/432 TaxID=1284355 RepID=A0A8J4SBP5_9STRA|nr:hypothetical protein G195_002962 [Phytophthora kernoviae 00238/432]